MTNPTVLLAAGPRSIRPTTKHRRRRPQHSLTPRQQEVSRVSAFNLEHLSGRTQDANYVSFQVQSHAPRAPLSRCQAETQSRWRSLLLHHSCSAPSNELCVMIFSAICPTNSIEELVIVIPGQRHLPLNDHQSITTFTNTLFHNDSSHRFLVRARHRTRTTIVRVFAFLPSVDFRLLESRITITIVRIDTIEARSAQSACAHTAIVNIAARNSH